MTLRKRRYEKVRTTMKAALKLLEKRLENAMKSIEDRPLTARQSISEQVLRTAYGQVVFMRFMEKLTNAMPKKDDL